MFTQLNISIFLLASRTSDVLFWNPHPLIRRLLITFRNRAFSPCCISRGKPHQSVSKLEQNVLSPPSHNHPSKSASCPSTPRHTKPEQHSLTAQMRTKILFHSDPFIVLCVLPFPQTSMSKEEKTFPNNHAWISRNQPVDGKGISTLPTHARDFGTFARSASERAFLNPFEQTYQIWRSIIACRAPYAHLLFIVACMISREDAIRAVDCCCCVVVDVDSSANRAERSLQKKKTSGTPQGDLAGGMSPVKHSYSILIATIAPIHSSNTAPRPLLTVTKVPIPFQAVCLPRLLKRARNDTPVSVRVSSSTS